MWAAAAGRSLRGLGGVPCRGWRFAPIQPAGKSLHTYTFRGLDCVRVGTGPLMKNSPAGELKESERTLRAQRRRSLCRAQGLPPGVSCALSKTAPRMPRQGLGLPADQCGTQGAQLGPGKALGLVGQPTDVRRLTGWGWLCVGAAGFEKLKWADSASSWCRTFTSYHAPEQKGTLVRDFIHDSLYHPTEGYFTSRPVSVGVMPQPLDFRHLQGQSEYTKTIGRLYRELEASWLTPVEIFRPWYTQAIGQYILEAHAKQIKQSGKEHPLLIYEIGGGSGTCARDMMDFLAKANPAVYNTMEYRTIEISASLAAAQHKRVCEVLEHETRYKVWAGCDAANVESWGDVDDRPCFIIMLEVLDNMPHDRVCHTQDGWMQTAVLPAASPVNGAQSENSLTEVLEPANDHLIRRCLAALHPKNEENRSAAPTTQNLQNLLSWMMGEGDSNVEFIPTSSMALFDVLCTMRPAHRLIAADFDALPDVTIPGRNAPLVASKREGRTYDSSTYLVPRGEADIFFPTDFDALVRIYSASRAEAQVRIIEGATTSTTPIPETPVVMTTRNFMQRYAVISSTETVDGYNPLLEDFTNTRFFLT